MFKQFRLVMKSFEILYFLTMIHNEQYNTFISSGEVYMNQTKHKTQLCIFMIVKRVNSKAA